MDNIFCGIEQKGSCNGGRMNYVENIVFEFDRVKMKYFVFRCCSLGIIL